MADTYGQAFAHLMVPYEVVNRLHLLLKRDPIYTNIHHQC